MLIPVTAFVASVLGFFYIKLALNVIQLRRTNQVSLGTGDNPKLERAVRAHGNFSEYVPLMLILLGAFELNGGPYFITGLLGIVFIAGRLIHAKGVQDPPPIFIWRVIGMHLTFWPILAACAANIGLILLTQL